jgi:hypothetical protein
VGKHEVPSGPDGQAARRELRRQKQQRRAADAGRLAVSGLPAAIASGFMAQTDVPFFVHPFLIAFGALLPLFVIGGLATRSANFIGDRRTRRLAKPRPRRPYLWMALGCAVTAAVFRLLVWAEESPGGSGDWVAAGLRWAALIGACAAFMMAGRALTAGHGAPSAWLSRLRRNRLADGPAAGGADMLGQ